MIVGFGIGFTALGAFLAAVILVGQLMANYLSNAGGAWDNAKKYIEDGNEGGKGSDATRPPSSPTPWVTRSRTPPVRRSTR